MRIIRLSSAADRKNAWVFAAFLVLLILIVMFSFNRGIGYFILIALCCVFAVAMAAVYLLAVTKAAVEVDSGSRLIIHGLANTSADCKDAVSVKTAPVSIGPIRTRSILLCDSRGETVCTVVTMFMSHEGAMAEPAAMELASLLNLDFEPTVERWKYDKNAMQEHKENEKRLKKEKKSRSKSRAFHTDNSDINEKASENGINYDAMDDER